MRFIPEPLPGLGIPNVGVKRTCVACAVRFYDLARTPASCPRCGAEQPPPKTRSALPLRAAPQRWSPGRPQAVRDLPSAEPVNEPVEAEEDTTGEDLDSVDENEDEEDMGESADDTLPA